jgi:hypothetical protein
MYRWIMARLARAAKARDMRDILAAKQQLREFWQSNNVRQST